MTLQLYPYQETGRDFLIREKRCMLADQPGLGKTGQCLTALRVIMQFWGLRIKVCIICPRTAIDNWRREFIKWAVSYRPENVLITNYEQIVHETADQKRFLETDWDVVIVDEAHKLKNAGALRTKIIYRHIFRTEYVWLLTGTPARNHAGELWTHIKALRPQLIKCASGIMTQEQFENEYCRIRYDQFGNRKVVGSKNMGQLRALLEQAGFFLRRRKTDVLPDLPALTFDTYPLPSPNHIPGLDGLASTQGRRIANDLRNMTDDQVVDFLENAPANYDLSTLLHVLGLAKAPLVADWVHEELAAPGQVIVFYKHRDVGDILEQRLGAYDPARVDGKTKDVMAEVDKFQDDNQCRVFLGQIQSCQEALNLTRADQSIFAEASWSPSDNEQAACRGHRIGMQPGYVARFASLTGTLDDVVMRVLQRKTDELFQLFG